MTSLSPEDAKSAPASAGTALSAISAFGAGFAVAGLAAGGVALLAASDRAGLALALALAAAVALVVGLLVALALGARLRELDRALASLGCGEPVALSSRGWPLGAIPAHLAAASARMSAVAERERQAEAYRAELTRQVSEAAAREERNRLARELHDSIKQQLFSIDVSAAAARARAGGEAPGALGALDDIQAGARAAQAEMTALLQQLRPAPLENVGLVEALRDQATALGYRTSAEVRVSIGDLPPAEALPPSAQEELFRMAQEALANVARHARARHVTLRLERAGAAMLLEIHDDGQGFDSATAPSGMGLANLRERARALGGTARITSAPGAGTAVRIEIPVVTPKPAPTLEEQARSIALAAAGARGEWWRRWSDNIQRVTFLLLLIGLPFWVVALGFALGGLAWAQLRLSLNEVKRLAGASSEPELNLRRGDRESLAILLVGFALCAGYLTASPPAGWPPSVTPVVAAALVVALLALALASWNGWRRATARWYRLLAGARRLEEVERRWAETLAGWGLTAIVVIVGLLAGGWAPVLAPRTPRQWTDTTSVALIVLLIALNAIESLLVWRWRRQAIAAASAARESEVAA